MEKTTINSHIASVRNMTSEYMAESSNALLGDIVSRCSLAFCDMDLMYHPVR